MITSKGQAGVESGDSPARTVIGESKNCLTCAFCTRNKDTWLSNFFKPQHSRWKRVQETLTTLERSALKSGNDSFVGQEIRDAELWDKQFEQEQEKNRQQYKGTPFEGMFNAQRALSISPNKNVNEEAATYGMSVRPKAPDEDYLSCFHEQWDERKNSEIQKDRRNFLGSKKCHFYYHFEKMSGETLEACEKNRRDVQDRNRFFITTILIVAGIVATVVLGVLALPVQEKAVTTPPILAVLASPRMVIQPECS
jgi:hypothetical protein